MSNTVPTTDGAAKPVVTLFETYGSGASYIGPRVAQVLGLPFHGQAFSSQEIEEAESWREKEGLLSRVVSAMGSSSWGGLDVGDVTAAQRDKYELVMQNNRTVQDFAREGGVIMGRNGAFILADRPATLHVKLDGPLEQRIARAAKDSGIDIARAAKRQVREDQVRADMSIDLYGWDPRGNDRYDMVLNTGTMNLDACVEIIVLAYRVESGHRVG